ncbi:hypothetical protein HZH66_008583 [Vespula vulgaris]|uniref:Uncharacterized protein n=1 Tax=Vespula vulgaris TaxID=7454 RepID=A0A834N1V3_VESVU|nr:hypothetical protein HZH66_008583 [Vespula vulgaris]
MKSGFEPISMAIDVNETDHNCLIMQYEEYLLLPVTKSNILSTQYPSSYSNVKGMWYIESCRSLDKCFVNKSNCIRKYEEENQRFVIYPNEKSNYNNITKKKKKKKKKKNAAGFSACGLDVPFHGRVRRVAYCQEQTSGLEEERNELDGIRGTKRGKVQ